ncbi:MULTISPECIES: anaerobic ribonucleoside-triphosphate reductase [unclassified Granulicatella]|uniref:anaerobic ribonucleoside-triphosphate reductase n=1 Tax=unclassified Granulicatella TaxID=2630493 RepID=UPI0010746BCD|nr:MULTISPECIES: anaerobic ribonucleoside-triphosphate reductase [unclassified Granulicatella]MBF0780832.1 anaerobic ribonucleoside-triphosphate reductase [Granulicatella sp. 19428wC4_WM01]TFU93519.1 anaerobic ribonucleoside-triphosphate reductase [Granulicatella sp. WM01]
MKVIKRDGRVENYYIGKLRNSLFRLGDLPENILNTVVLSVDKWITEQENQIIYTKDIQDYLLEKLDTKETRDLKGRYHYYQTTKYVNQDRESDIHYLMDKLMNRDKTVIHENANKDSDVFNTQRDLTAGTLAKAMGLKLLPKHVANAHLKGDIHYHDLDYQPYMPMTNCCLIDFKSMFEQGFKIGNAEVESPKSIQTATAQMAQIIANVASSQYGGCSADRIDEVLAPYAKLNYQKHLNVAKEWIEQKEKQEAYAKERVTKDIYDAMQSLEYEINTLYSSQGQTPFTTLGFGLGKNWFEREIQKAILNVRIKGIGKEARTAIFPKLVFTLKRGLNLHETDPNYDIKQLAIECATKRMYPDVLSYDKIIELTGSFKVPMGCRSFLQGWQDDLGREINAGRMNLGVVTLNLPRIALESSGDMNVFWQILDDKLSICHDALTYRVNRVKDALPTNAPILYMHGAFGRRLGIDEPVDELFKNKRATVSLGYIGLYEVATVFYGSDWEHNTQAKQFTLDILKTLKQYTDDWGNRYGYHFSVYATPSESLTDRFCRLDTQKFGYVNHVTDKEYYTNSFHYDVRKNPTPFEKIEFEKDYPYFSSGGFIHYCEYPVMKQNPKGLEAVWDFAYDRIGYLGTNTPIDHCYECGFDGDFMPTAKGFKCPSCSNTNPKTCDVVKRTCGYLGNPQARPMVHGRHVEISSRVKHVRLNDERSILWQVTDTYTSKD